jgi:ankyrin repeat protein
VPSSALDSAWNAVLKNEQDEKVEKAFREIFSLNYDCPWIEEQQFQPLHKIVLGFSTIDLSSILQLSTSSIDKTDAKGKTPLAWAATRGDQVLLQTLLDHGANPNTMCVTGNSPLLRAVRARSPGCILPLLRYGASISFKSSLGFSALHYAAYYKDDIRFIAPLLEYGADTEAKDGYGWTALSCAAERDKVEIAKALIRNGADLNSRDDSGWTPLLRSVYQNSHQVLTLLLDEQADYSVISSNGDGILHLAAARADSTTLNKLTNATLKWLDVDARNNNNLTAEEVLAKREFSSTDTASEVVSNFTIFLKSVKDS